MQIVFRKLGPAAVPAQGELFIRLESNDARRDALATLVLESGPQAFPQGTGPVETLVLQPGPTLDDMLAALLLEEQLAGHELPKGIEPFARYAHLRRTGLTPSSVPLEVSLEGIYLAILNGAGGNLTQAETAAHFVASWRRMARVIWQAAAAGADPFSTELFSDGGEFALERAFLKQDRAVFQLDVGRGKQWLVKIPGAARGGRMLLLREPKSLLFAPWSREPDASGAKQPFVFLAVDWGQGAWVFSTDPVQRLTIPTLADALQRAEVAADPQSAALEPWVKRFGDSLVANRQTKLPAKEVISRMKHWAHAWPIIPAWVYATAAVLLVVVVLHFLPGPAPAPVLHVRGDTTAEIPPPEHPYLSPDEQAKLTGPNTNYALLFATNSYKTDWAHLDNPIRDGEEIRKSLANNFGFQATCYEDQTKKQIEATIHQFLEQTKFGPQSELLVYFGGHGYFDDAINKGYIVANDSLHEKGADRNASCLSLDDLASTLDKVPCRHVLLLLDTCFGGTVLPKYSISRTRGDSDTRSTTEFLQQLLEPRSRIVLASVGKREALDGTGNHSPFAARVIDALNVKPGDGMLSARTLYTAAARGTQPPVFGGLPGQEDGGEFFFFVPPASQ